MRVLHFLKSNIYSGAEHVVCTIIHNMSKDDECYYVSPNGLITQRLEKEKINHIVIDKMTLTNVKKIIKKTQPDVVHAHDFTASVIVACACKNIQLMSGKRPKVISHLHSNPTWLQTKNMRTILYQTASQWIDTILVVSDAIKEEYVFHDRLLCPVVTMGNPFSVQEILQSAGTNDLGVRDLQSDILYVGRLSQPKNPLGFLEVIARLSTKIDMTRMHIIMVGDGELKPQCQIYLEQHHLADAVKLVGFQQNPYAYMANTKILIMPSEWEGFGLVALEAMALGVPVVCSGAGGLRIIVDESCGKIIDRKEYDSLEDEYQQYVDELRLLMLDESYRKMKSDNARRQAERFDNLDAYMEKLYTIYEGNNRTIL